MKIWNQKEVKQGNVDESLKFIFAIQLRENNSTYDFPIIYNKTEKLVDRRRQVCRYFFWFKVGETDK